MTKFNDCRAFVICSSLITRFTILRLFVEVVRRAANNVSILVLTPFCQDVILKPTMFRILRDRILDRHDHIQTDGHRADNEMAIRRIEAPSKL